MLNKVLYIQHCNTIVVQLHELVIKQVKGDLMNSVYPNLTSIHFIDS